MEDSFRETFLVKELINGVRINYEQYNDHELLEILTCLNNLARTRKNIFCFEEKAIENYKKIVDVISDCVFDKRVLIAYTEILYLEKMLEDDELKKQLKSEFIREQITLRKIENRDDIDSYLKKCINMDKILIVYIHHKSLFYSRKNEEELDFIRSSVNYFYNRNEINKELYDDFVHLYCERNIHLFDFVPCKILKFPVKKQSLLATLLKR